MENIIGIDLGTTNARVSVMQGDKPVVIADSGGSRFIPSVVSFSDGMKVRVGDSAKSQMTTNPLGTVHSFRRLIGEPYDGVIKNGGMLNYGLGKDKDGNVCAKVGTHIFSLLEISSLVIRRMKQTAENYLGQAVTEAVITVPAFFTVKQRKAVKEAGKMAGLSVRRIISDPTAAVLGYACNKTDEDINIGVFELGGGCFDFSIYRLGDGVIELVSTKGSSRLGGEDFTQAIVNWLKSEIQMDEGITIMDSVANQRLRDAAEKAKIELSISESADISIPYLEERNGNYIHVNKRLTRKRFEVLVNDFIQTCVKGCEDALRDAQMSKVEIDEIIMVGGSTRIPAIQDAVGGFFGKAPSKGFNPDEVVVLGAALQGGMFNGMIKDTIVLDAISMPIGIEVAGGIMSTVFDAYNTIPSIKSDVYSTSADNQNSVSIKLYQGESQKVADNKFIDEFVIRNIPPAPRGVPQIEITFDIDLDGILKISTRQL